MTPEEIETLTVNRMSEEDFRQRDPDWSKNHSAPSSSGVAVWNEADRARKSETVLLEEVRRLRECLARLDLAPLAD